VGRPEDLHDVPRNLYATALLLRQLMDEGSGDLREALRAYHGGPRVGSGKGRDSDQYVARVSTYYAYLKGRRTYRQLAAAQPAQTKRAKK
jgi:soluble lytic murein transglycosylase-like protein